MAGSELELIEEVVVAGAGGRRHRSRAGLQRLPDGRLLAAYRVGWEMFGRPHGAVVCTWSEDGGMHWETPQPVVAAAGWDWYGAQRLVQFDDGGLLLLAGRARWEAGDFETIPLRSYDGGRTWERDDGAIEVCPLESEPYGRGAG